MHPLHIFLSFPYANAKLYYYMQVVFLVCVINMKFTPLLGLPMTHVIESNSDLIV